MGPGDENVPAAADIELSDEQIEALKRKYDDERDKRLDAQPRGKEQYVRLADLASSDARFARMLEDPYPGVETRHPLTDDVLVCVVGAGYGGLCAGARLVEAGVDPQSIRLVDKGRDVGGTWYWNRYPGASCDIESYVYMPLCDELGYVPTEKYAHQPEIQAHAQLIAKTYGLYGNACFGAQVTRLEWDDAAGMWTVHTDRNDAFRARYAIVNFGVLTDPKLPNVPGVTSYEGHIFHTSRWDYAYTGGSSTGGLHKLGDKRVALIGTGATAVQVTPHLGEGAGQLFVFQRTPSSVDIRNNGATTEEFAREFLSTPGWQRERNENFYALTQTLKGAPKDLVNDGWTDIIRNVNVKTAKIFRSAKEQAKKEGAPAMDEIMKSVRRANDVAQLQQMEKIRRRADVVVRDPATAEALKPWYNQFCKRPCFHDSYLTTFNRPNVTLVHTNGLGIERFTPKGVVANGTEYEVDCIVMATGFEVGALFPQTRPSSFSIDIVGREGATLQQKWDSAEHRYGPGPKTYRSHHTSGFPNLCLQNAPQGAFTTNFVLNVDEASRHFAHVIARVEAEGRTRFDVKPEVEERYLDEMWKLSPASSGKQTSCTPGYYNNEGKVDAAGTRKLFGAYPGAAMKLFKALEKERKEGTALDIFNID